MLVITFFEEWAGNVRGFWRETFCKGLRLGRLGSFANGSITPAAWRFAWWRGSRFVYNKAATTARFPSRRSF